MGDKLNLIKLCSAITLGKQTSAIWGEISWAAITTKISMG